MSQRGIFALQNSQGGDFSITQAGIQVGNWVDDLDGMLAVTFEYSFALGTLGSGSKIQAYLQTSFDQGATAVDIACVTATNVGKTCLVNLSGLTPRTTEYSPTDGALADDSCADGMLGDRLRLKVITTGTYGANCLLTARVAIR